MICTEVYISKYNWHVHCFFAVDRYYTKSILHVLDSLGCSRDIYERVSKKLEDADLDSGFTFSNTLRHESLFVIGLASSSAQYINSISHELRHLCDDIASASAISLDGEAVAYLAGDVAQTMAEPISALTCSCGNCRNRRLKLKSIYQI